jgi:SRSO17 transposase
VPEEVNFKTKPEIALEQIDAACKAGLPGGVVLMDAGYGCNTDLRTGVRALTLCYRRHLAADLRVGARHGVAAAEEVVRPRTTTEAHSPRQPISVKKLALGLLGHAWRTITWRDGTADRLSSRFARVRVRVAHRDYNLSDSRPEEWLLIEWSKGEGAWTFPRPSGLSSLRKRTPS